MGGNARADIGMLARTCLQCTLALLALIFERFQGVFTPLQFVRQLHLTLLMLLDRCSQRLQFLTALDNATITVTGARHAHPITAHPDAVGRNNRFVISQRDSLPQSLRQITGCANTRQ